ncbi:MAG: PTS sugar transporter subunit IIA [Rhodobacteraceae bacterium]|nr:PTS sugar transporter subunit IIA [Paracoccaceae bacterium]
MQQFIELTPPEAVFANLRASSKKSLLQELANKAAEQIGVDSRALFSELMERERLGTTGMGRGVAIPHCRLPKLDRIRGFLARLDTAVDFEAVDGQPVDLAFLLVAPESAGSDHLKALARVSRIFRDSDTCAKMRGAKDGAALHALLASPERVQAA